MKNTSPRLHAAFNASLGLFLTAVLCACNIQGKDSTLDSAFRPGLGETNTNSAPVASNSSLSVIINTATPGTLSGADANNDTLNFSIGAQGTLGTVTITNAATGAFTYTPLAATTGSDSFTFKVSDGKTSSNTATVTVTIYDPNTPPVASNISPAAFNEDVQSVITLSYSDVDGDLGATCAIPSVTNVIVTQACACNGAGVCTVGVTSTSNYNGAASFGYTVTANSQTSNTATATLSILAVNDAPTISAIVSADDAAGTWITNEDVAQAVTFTIADAETAIACNSTYLSMSSSATGVVANASVVWSGTAPNCTATITPVADAYGTPTITITVTDTALTASNNFVLTVTRLGDDALNPANIPFTALTTASYTSSDWTKMDFTGGVVRLTATDQTDSATNTFTGGSLTGVVYSASGLSDGSSGLKLDSSGTPTNNSELDSSWTPQWASLVSYWKMNNAWTDSVAGGTATAINGATFTTSSKIGSHAGSFDGVNDYVNLASANYGFNGATEISISIWINTSAANGRIMQKEISDGWSTFNIIVNASKFYFDIESQALNEYPTWQSSSNIPSGWNHHLATFKKNAINSTDAVVYLNGTAISTTYTANSYAANFQMQESSSNLVFGARPVTINNFFAGQVDDIAIWSKALSATEAKTIYDRQSAKYAGTFTSRVMDATTSSSWKTLTWLPTLPFFKELPDAACTAPCTHSNTESNNSTTGYVSAVGSGGSTATNDLMSNIVGLWHLDETAATAGAGNDFKDDSGGGSYGEAAAGVTFGSNGKLDKAATFNNSNTGYIGLVNNSIATTVGDFTLSAWIKSNSVTGWDTIIGLGTGGDQLGLFLQDGKVTVYVTGFAPTNKPGTTTLTPGVWYHVAFTRSGANWAAYVNGASDGSGTWVATTINLSGAFRGIGGDANTENFDGTIDEVAIWNRPLHANEVKQLYQRGASRLKYNVRTCTASNCSDQDALVGKGWIGPTGQADAATSKPLAYFSEINNNTKAIDDGTGDVKKTLPTMDWTTTTGGFPLVNTLTGQYFQYRAIFETDDSTIANGPELKSVSAGPNHYDTSNPYIYNNTGIGIDFYTLSSFTETLGTGSSPDHSCSGAKYQLSSNNSTWWWYTAGAWAQTSAALPTAYNEANTAAQLTGGAMTAFPAAAGTGVLQLKTFLHSDGLNACEIDDLAIGGAK